MSSSETPVTSTSSQYVILAETNGQEFETWYYFIKYEGNEKALSFLDKQLNKIEDMVVIDELSTFDLDLEHKVSEKTAKEMSKVELNSVMFHRKFDGKLQNIDLGISRRDTNMDKLCKLYEVLGMGKIEDFIDQEDIDPEDLIDEEEEEEDYSDETEEDAEEEDIVEKIRNIIAK